MMGFKVFDYWCDACQLRNEHVVTDEEIAEGAKKECFSCGEVVAYRVISAPAIRTEDNAVTFLDGTKRKGLDDMKKIAKLEVQKAGLDKNDPKRGEINAEIRARRAIPK
jgi:hypothetical protein